MCKSKYKGILFAGGIFLLQKDAIFAKSQQAIAFERKKKLFFRTIFRFFQLNNFTILTTFSSCSILVRWLLNMHLLIKNQVLASGKNMISSAISTLLTNTGIFRLNGHGFVYFIFCYVFFSFIYFMKKCNNCNSVELILYTFQLIIKWLSSTRSQYYFESSIIQPS